MFDLTDEQRAAIHARHEDYVVSAAAGSGKTTVLTKRFIYLVQEQGLRPDEILTITFTKKAAAEMKGRIVEMLRDCGLSQMAQEAETGPVQTIHSFCDRLLRENALAAGIDPSFKIKSQIGPWVDEEVRDILGEPDLHDPLIDQFVLEMSQQNYWGRMHCEVIPAEILSAVRGTHWTPETLKAHAESQISFLEPYREFLEARANSDKLSPRRQPDILETVLDPGIASWGIRAYRHVNHTDHMVELTRGAVLLAAGAWEGLERRFEREQEFDFSELERRAVALLRDNPAVRERIRAQFRALLIDEAQDNNPVQNELIQLLGIGNTMVVGDPQQSIYGFRQAAPHLFEQRLNQTTHLRLSKNKRSTQGILKFIDEAFKSRWGSDYEPMAEVFDLDRAELDYQGVEFWEAESEGFLDTMAFNVLELNRNQGVQLKDIAILVRTHEMAHHCLIALRKQGIDAEISGGRKFHSRLVVRDVSNMLEALLNPADDFALFAVLRSPFVGLSLDATVQCALQKPIINHLDKVQLEAEDQDKLDRFVGWFRPATATADRLSAWEALSLCYLQSALMENLAKLPDRSQAIANARKLLAMAANDREIRPQEFADNIRRSQSRARDEEGDAPTADPNAPVVKIMTIHTAKGLEFPCVIIPDTNQEYGQLRRTEIHINATHGMFYLDDEMKQWPHKIIEELAVKQLSEEEFRIDYVAMTRAKERLVFMIQTGAKKRTACLATFLKAIFWPTEGPSGGIVVRQSPALYAISGDGEAQSVN